VLIDELETFNPKLQTPTLCQKTNPRFTVLHVYLTSGAAATAISLFIASAVSSAGLPSNIRLHHIGGSNGRDPLCSGGYTSQKKYHTCPITTPIISSLGIVPWSAKLKAINTQGRYGAVKTNRPKKLNRVSGFRLDQM